ncbi:MAG TPA: prepilin-type N-terminal cleavage/methylation domain-containing protein [Anaeromyxobacter sp.]|nr:prepilin-type N-terminal cleavage/methylation domain-containing protein [Anaeromyxobacter sp.]
MTARPPSHPLRRTGPPSHPLRRTGHAGRGFTLLEVMVALAILATSLLAISDVVGGALRNQARARNVELAALLARGKMAQVMDHYEWKGFKATDESDEGTFEEEGHPELAWRLEVKAPPGTLTGDQMVRALTGSDLNELLPPPDQAPQLAPFQALLTATLQTMSAKLGETVKRGLREVTLTVAWQENGREESFDVKTHLLVVQPGETLSR